MMKNIFERLYVISLQNIDYYISGRRLLENVSFQISTKQHVGLIGRNGSGKTTLFKIIQKKSLPDSGKIDISNNWRILSVKQEMPEGSLTPIEYLLSQDIERHNLLLELESSPHADRMCEIYDRLIQIDAYGAESRASVVLNGLGFDEEAQNRPINTFSGGFRMRMSLGAVLFQEPELLLLDEPTNHLDLETSDWLENFLKKYMKSFILISHDRDFLNSTATSILHLKNSKITRYNGNFDTFIDTYNLKQQNIEVQNAKIEEKRKHMMEFINKFQAKATKAKQAQSRLKAIAKMKFIHVEKDDLTVALDFPIPDPLFPPILSFEKVSLGYVDKIVLKNISGSIMPDDRIAIVGINGNGKTTLARFLAGELQQKKGIREASNKLKVGFYKQDQLESLNSNILVYDHMKLFLPNETDLQIRSHLGRFGFGKEKSCQEIKALSGGERARLLFASLTARKPNLLILDEPTNHLDLEMRESLIAALTTYQGAVILITHDRNLLNKVANTILIVKDQKITQFDGDLESYERELISNYSSIT